MVGFRCRPVLGSRRRCAAVAAGWVRGVRGQEWRSLQQRPDHQHHAAEMKLAIGGYLPLQLMHMHPAFAFLHPAL